MVSVILIWIYMLFTCYVPGFTALGLLSGKERQIRSESGCLYAGIVIVTVYAQFFSLFHKVGLAANLLLLLLCAACLFVRGRQMAEHIRGVLLTVTPARAGAAVFLFFLFAYGTSTGIIHYDTGLYHAQSIRWIEEYGVVPGLGNLHSRQQCVLLPVGAVQLCVPGGPVLPCLCGLFGVAACDGVRAGGVWP